MRRDDERDDNERNDDDNQRTERVHGPYKHGDQWRVIRVDADGSRGRRAFKSEALALAYIRLFKDETDSRTISMTVDEYLAQLRARGLKSVVTVGYRLRGLLQTKAHDRKLASLTPKLAKRLFVERAAKTKPALPREGCGAGGQAAARAERAPGRCGVNFPWELFPKPSSHGAVPTAEARAPKTKQPAFRLVASCARRDSNPHSVTR